jgi:hypothetical protein
MERGRKVCVSNALSEEFLRNALLLKIDHYNKLTREAAKDVQHHRVNYTTVHAVTLGATSPALLGIANLTMGQIVA